MVVRVNKLLVLSVALLALAASCVKEELPAESPADRDKVETSSDEEAERVILKSLLAGRDTRWTVDDLDIPTLEGEWYGIQSAEELAYLLEFGSIKGEKYRLMADVDVASSSIADKLSGEIGAEPFENFEFDGNGKTISGLNLPLAAGLFSRVKDSRIYNFTLASCTVGSPDNVSNLLGTGAVIGSASGEIEVSNVTVSGCNVYAPCKLGGFVGEVTDGSATFASCAVSATNVNGMYLKGISGWCGGFVGFVGRTREDDTASMVNVTFDNCDVNEGAVKPYMESDLRTCGQFLGMLIGFDSNETVTMSGCDVQTTYEGQDAKSQVNPHYVIGGHKYDNGVILVDGLSYVYPWDGKTIRQPALTDGVYDVYTAEELAWFQDKTETTHKIHIRKDIDLAGHLFTPVKEVKMLEGLKEDGTNSEIRNLKIDFKQTEGENGNEGYGGAFINYVNTAGTVHQNINFRWADIYVSHYDVVPDDITNAGQYGNGYAGTLCSRHNLKPGTTKDYTIRNVHCYDGKIDAVCKMGGLLGGSWGTLTVDNCSVEGYWIENHDANCLNGYFEQVGEGWMSVTCAAQFFTEGECGGLIGFIAKNSDISGCSVKGTKIKCYGQQDQKVKFIGGVLVESLVDKLGKMSIPGRHVNQFIGDIRTESSDESNLITVNITEPVVSGNVYVGSGYMYDKKKGNVELSADSQLATTYDYNHSWSDSSTPYIGCAYYVGASVASLDTHMGDYPGNVYVTKNGFKTSVEVFGGLDNDPLSETSGLSVISFNVRVPAVDDGDNQWENRKPATLAMINDYRPDIFGVQEALLEQLRYIGNNLPNYSYVGVSREDGKTSNGETMAIFYNTSKIELLDWGTYWLSETPDEPSKGWDAACKRTMTWARMEMKDSGKEFFYVNTHLDHVGTQARQKGLDLIVSKIAAMNPDNLPIVLTGDFNVQPDNPALTELNTKMSDARKTAEKTDDHATYHGWGKYASVIDYIYYSGFSSCLEYETIVKTYENVPYISDHYPIVARLMF